MIHIPAKTFVLGEYSVTEDGLAIVLLSEPCFEARFSAGAPAELSAPIAKFINLHPQELANTRCDFIDPYHGVGGLGASSAEFLAWIKYYHQVKGGRFDITNAEHYQQALQEFIVCSSGATGIRPSGADMIAQNARGLAFVDLSSSRLESIAWPFDEIELCLVHTKHKVATHEHLAKVKSGGDFSLLGENARSFKRALAASSVDGVVGSINSSCAELDRLGFLRPRSKEIINSALNHDFCLAAKGCGAMGADVILFVFRAGMASDAKKFIGSEGLGLIWMGRA